MPRIADDTTMETFTTGAGFGFTGIGIDHLGAAEYTLVDIVIDFSSSVSSFAADLRNALITAVDACKKSPRSDNLLIRVTTFSSYDGVVELHGYKPLSSIDAANDYPVFHPRGNTPLFDATFAAITSMVTFGSTLMDADFNNINGIIFIITDGADNDSSATPAMIAKAIKDLNQQEKLESLVTVLIGINASYCSSYLSTFQKEAGLDQFIDAGDATRSTLAKLADFVSQSISSQSQSLGTGGPSQTIAATI